MAERLVSRELGVQVASAGIGAVVGASADPVSVELLRERGIDLSDHVARALTAEMVRTHDLILTMEAWQTREVERRFPTARGKVFRLGHWGDFDVPDPYGRSREMFVEVLKLVDRGCADVAHALGRPARHG